MLHTTPRRRCAPTTTDRGTALVLVPALLLVLMALGAIAIDGAVLHSAHRSVHRTVSAAADDAASSIDEAEVYRSGRVSIDPGSAERVAAARIAAASLPGELAAPVDVRVIDDAQVVEVTVRVDVPKVLSVPFRTRSKVETIEVTARARMRS